jgi:hypothetical protein
VEERKEVKEFSFIKRPHGHFTYLHHYLHHLLPLLRRILLHEQPITSTMASIVPIKSISITSFLLHHGRSGMFLYETV